MCQVRPQCFLSDQKIRQYLEWRSSPTKHIVNIKHSHPRHPSSYDQSADVLSPLSILFVRSKIRCCLSSIKHLILAIWKTDYPFPSTCYRPKVIFINILIIISIRLMCQVPSPPTLAILFARSKIRHRCSSPLWFSQPSNHCKKKVGHHCIAPLTLISSSDKILNGWWWIGDGE